MAPNMRVPTTVLTYTSVGAISSRRRVRRSYSSLRHSSITNVYKATRDLFLAQRFARHVSPLTTTGYTHPSDQEIADRLRSLGC